MTKVRAFLCTCLCFGVLSLFAKPTVANSSNYDVVYHRISFTIATPSSGTISNGSVTTYFKTTVANVSTLQFDLDGAMTASSASYHGSGIGLSQNTSTDIITLTLPSTLAAAGTLDSVTVNFSGTPATPSTSIPSGYNVVQHTAGQYAVFTLDEAFTAHYWWPCKESLYDKIDSVDLVVTTPSAYRVASNGVLKGEPIVGPNRITTWKTRYRIATYGINFALANYKLYTFNITSALSGKTFPVNNYFYPEDSSATFNGYANQLQNIIPKFENKLNVPYPFSNEQYGLAECSGTNGANNANNWGALEVQSMTFICRSSYSDNGYTIAHEAAHQWFGDMATTNTWQQVWLNEGFATYFEKYLYPELIRTIDIQTKRTANKTAVTSGTRVFVTDTSNADRIFFGNGTPAAQPYEKGGMFLSMLRTWVGDAGFFSGLHDYLNAPGVKYNFGAVDTLKKYMQPYTPNNLDNFFNDWVNKPGYTSYALSWGNNGKRVKIRLVQSVAGGGTGYYDMPVPIHITNGTGLDTTVIVIDRRGVLYNNVTGTTSGTNTITLNFSQVPTTFDIDAQDLVLTSGTSYSYLAILPVHDVSLKATEEARQTKLDWLISGAENLTKVDLERSGDGTNFLSLNSVAVHANTDGIVQGNFVDNRFAAASFYRLKMTQKDGQVQYSTIEKVNGTGNYELSVVPNPVNASFRVSRPSAFDADCILTIRNLSGQVVKSLPLSFGSDGWVTVSFDGMDAGAYVATLSQSGKESAQVRFMKL